ncbi:expressed unknown protein [Seminavis robusta]|uniref:Uncharacterized protein n=1 Tax=Seminavis robusta TaxID=568900 RepID=A0A9N8E368_9STRA|nr:expressed unknown protein [Seminavis robusta]|eukprot:Sro508_g156920.1 n/a (517) ;mRNA; r:58338-59888
MVKTLLKEDNPPFRLSLLASDDMIDLASTSGEDSSANDATGSLGDWIQKGSWSAMFPVSGKDAPEDDSDDEDFEEFAGDGIETSPKPQPHPTRHIAGYAGEKDAAALERRRRLTSMMMQHQESVRSLGSLAGASNHEPSAKDGNNSSLTGSWTSMLGGFLDANNKSSNSINGNPDDLKSSSNHSTGSKPSRTSLARIFKKTSSKKVCHPSTTVENGPPDAAAKASGKQDSDMVYDIAKPRTSLPACTHRKRELSPICRPRRTHSLQLAHTNPGVKETFATERKERIHRSQKGRSPTRSVRSTAAGAHGEPLVRRTRSGDINGIGQRPARRTRSGGDAKGGIVQPSSSEKRPIRRTRTEDGAVRPRNLRRTLSSTAPTCNKGVARSSSTSGTDTGATGEATSRRPRAGRGSRSPPRRTLSGPSLRRTASGTASRRSRGGTHDNPTRRSPNPPLRRTRSGDGGRSPLRRATTDDAHSVRPKRSPPLRRSRTDDTSSHGSTGRRDMTRREKAAVILGDE